MSSALPLCLLLLYSVLYAFFFFFQTRFFSLHSVICVFSLCLYLFWHVLNVPDVPVIQPACGALNSLSRVMGKLGVRWCFTSFLVVHTKADEVKASASLRSRCFGRHRGHQKKHPGLELKCLHKLKEVLSASFSGTQEHHDLDDCEPTHTSNYNSHSCNHTSTFLCP